jgi:hypothetical protein
MGMEHATPGVVVILIVVLGSVLHYIRVARTRPGAIYVRRIRGIDAIDEGVGRTAELGRPLSFTTGMTGVGPVLYACLGVLSYVVKKAATYKTKLIIPQNSPEAMAIVEDVTRDAYRSAGKLSLFDPSSVVFLSEEQFAFASGYQGILHRERAGAAFLFGSFAAESLILAEAGQQVGAMQVAASMSPEQVAFFICTCDYTLIGEELFAASAYLSHEPVQLGSLRGQDVAKLMFFLLIVVGILVATLNSVVPSLALPNVDVLLTTGW